MPNDKKRKSIPFPCDRELSCILCKEIKNEKNTIFSYYDKVENSCFLGAANRFDIFIWDAMLRDKDTKIQVLTLFTKDIQANYFFFWDKDFNSFKFYNSFIPIKTPEFSPKDLNFMRTIGYKIDKEEFKKTFFLCNKCKLYVPQYIGTVFWNQYERINKKNSQDNPNPEMEFTRVFVPFFHRPRTLFQNIPLVTEAFPSEDIEELRNAAKEANNKNKDDDYKRVATIFYSLFFKQKRWIAGLGSPTCINLDQASNAMSNNKKGVTLVTGGPGTGKEAFTRAIHFSDSACDASTSDSISTITALDLHSKIKNGKSFEDIFCNLCQNDCKNKSSSNISIPPSSRVSFIIDELNKADSELLSSLLRVLESPKEEIKCRAGCILFILAASDHLEQLARKPPQDFWTRISYQMRVSHPLERVREEDAEDFLSSFFWYNWWLLSKNWLGVNDKNEEKIQDHYLLYEILGHELARDDIVENIVKNFGSKIKKKSLPQIVCETFILTLAPIAMRDQISIRGLRSIMEQIFTNITWGTRYGLVPCHHQDDTYEESIRRAVNHSIQTVLVILNAARDTPRTPSAAH